jgi:hypothetical protein
MFKAAAIALLLSTATLAAVDWRDSVKVWKVEPFFGEWVVVPDESMAYVYKGWKWLCIREARKLAADHGGRVEIRE